MKLDEKTKERINNYFNGISSEQAMELAVKYNITEALDWGKNQGESLPIDRVVESEAELFCSLSGELLFLWGLTISTFGILAIGIIATYCG